MVYMGVAMRVAFFLLSLLPLAAQDFSKVSVEKVAGGFEFTEGPVWSRDGYLLFSDVPDNKIYRINAQGKTVFREASNGANGNTFDVQGRLYSRESKTRMTRSSLSAT